MDAFMTGVLRSSIGADPQITSFPVPGGAGRRLVSTVGDQRARTHIIMRRPWIMMIGVSVPNDRPELLDAPEVERFIGSLRIVPEPAI